MGNHGPTSWEIKGLVGKFPTCLHVKRSPGGGLKALLPYERRGDGGQSALFIKVPFSLKFPFH